MTSGGLGQIWPGFLACTFAVTQQCCPPFSAFPALQCYLLGLAEVPLPLGSFL